MTQKLQGMKTFESGVEGHLPSEGNLNYQMCVENLTNPAQILMNWSRKPVMN